MSRLWPAGEEIEVYQDEWNRPSLFLWRGRHYPVEMIHQEWQVDTDWWDERGATWRDYFALTTSEGLLCVIYHDWNEESWRVAKVYD